MGKHKVVWFNGVKVHATEVGTDENGLVVNGSPTFGDLYCLPGGENESRGELKFAFYETEKVEAPKPLSKPANLPPKLPSEGVTVPVNPGQQ